jgi:hypothetical protein
MQQARHQPGRYPRKPTTINVQISEPITARFPVDDLRQIDQLMASVDEGDQLHSEEIVFVGDFVLATTSPVENCKVLAGRAVLFQFYRLEIR